MRTTNTKAKKLSKQVNKLTEEEVFFYYQNEHKINWMFMFIDLEFIV